MPDLKINPSIHSKINLMDQIEQIRQAKAFAKRWAGKGYEKGEAQKFWIDCLQNVLGMEDVLQQCKFEMMASNGGFIDIYIPDCGVLIEQKGINVNLDKAEPRQGRLVTPFQQAYAYTKSFTLLNMPRFIVTCNFKTFRVYDRNKYSVTELEDHPFEFSLDELSDHPEYLSFITDPKNSRLEKQKEISFQAGKQIGEIYTELKSRYLEPEAPDTQHALNVLCVRLVFCLFCEDTTDLFPRDGFLNYLREVPPQNIRAALKRLFKALDTPLDKRDPYDETVKAFPYVNGGLFTEETEIPNFDEDLKFKLLHNVSRQTDWSKISPTIFGGIFEGTLNPETRRSGGMHYTSPENIHKVIDPLFLDDLYQRFREITTDETFTSRQKNNKLVKLHEEICSLSFFDPACGSGNFLTETYLCLRRLEDDILRVLNAGQTEINFSCDNISNRVSLSQFYGIEINDFAVSVANVALWIARLQSNAETEMTLDMSSKNFPLIDCAHITEGNALRLNWEEVLPASKCSYIIGNPPFIGANNQSPEQKAEVQEIFKNHHHASLIDYVGCWYKKSTTYMQNNKKIKSAFVSTNSICQGEQVANLWKPLFDDGFEIIFAHKDFRWTNEATDGAHVFVDVIGFDLGKEKMKCLFTYETPDSQPVKSPATNINAYLINASNVFIERVAKPICCLPKMTKGCQPTDGGNLIIEAEDLDEFLSKEPKAERFIKKLVGSREFIQQRPRYCLWLVDATSADIQSMPLVKERVRACRDFRLSSSQAGTRRLAERCTTFRETYCPDTCLIVPSVCSERRKYLPIGYVDNTTISTNANLIIPDGTLFMFGVLSSQTHNAWMRVVCGRLESRYRYSAGVVYNNFPWPGVTKETLNVPVEECVTTEVRGNIEDCARAVLDAREFYVEQAKDAGHTCSLADMYDPDNDFLYSELTSAHKTLDKAVEEAYGVNFGGDEEKIVAHLFGLYEGLVAK